MIIGQPKNIEDLGLLAQSEIDEMIQGAREAVANGVPVYEIPAAMPLALLCRMATTLKAQREVLEGLRDLPKGIGFDEQLARTDAIKALEARAVEVLAAVKVLPPQNRILSLPKA